MTTEAVIKILVVEAEWHIMRLIQVHLQRAGYDVVMAFCGNDALPIVEREHPDLVIIDHTLPDIAGDELARMLHQRQSPPAMLLLFPKGIKEDWVQGWTAPANGYMTKPFNALEMVAFVARMLAVQPAAQTDLVPSWRLAEPSCVKSTMYHHAPDNYVCPFCLLVHGIENEHVYSVQSDIVYQDEVVTAFVSSHQFPNNAGNVLVIPNRHFENVYELPVALAADLHRVVRAVALAHKAALACDGVSTRQHNEPAGNQDVWHYHIHVTPRYLEDSLYSSKRSLMPVEERERYAIKIRAALSVVTVWTRLSE